MSIGRGSLNRRPMITFSPQWQTAAALADAIEGNPLTVALIAVSTGSITLNTGATELPLGLSASLVTAVRFNGSVSSYTSSGSSIFFSALTATTAIDVETSSELIYTLIGGKLPKGVFVSQQGIILGTPQGIKDEAGELFVFTVRVANGQTVRDRTFRMVVYPVAQTAVWNMTGLPLETSDTSLSTIPYRVLGEVKRGEAFSFSIDVAHPDGDQITVAIIASNGVVGSSSSYNGGLPPGLKLVGTSIEGVVLPSAAPGKYFFTLSVVAPSSPDPIPVMIEVLNLRTASFKRPVKMQWVTPAGSLGTLEELQVSNLNLHARNPNGGSVNYNLLSGTGGLPPGLMLNPQTGDIEGQVLFVTATSSYSFTVRASTGSIFTDRTFSITIKDMYQAEDISEVSLKFQGRDRKMALKGYGALIPSDWLYRSGDLHFGLVTEPYIHVARGLYPDATLEQLDYRENILCTFGPHAVAVVNNTKGEPIYEVLYRKIIDPMDADPFGNDDRSQGLVINYAQSKSEQKIHPMSIWNLRYDLLVDYGVDTGDRLPEWMGADQNIPGFKTAFAIAYLQPGMGAAALEMLDETITPNGYSVKFDRVLLSRVGNSMTTFDEDAPHMLPVYVPSGVTSITTGKWTGLVTEIFTVTTLVNGSSVRYAEDNTISTIDQAQTNMNIDNGTISFPSSSSNRMFYLFVTGSPPSGASCSNAPVGTDLILGPFIMGVSQVTSNGSIISDSALSEVPSLGILRKTSPFTAGTEIEVVLSETTFDDLDEDEERTLFDYQATPIGKYIKLTTEFKQYPS